MIKTGIILIHFRNSAFTKPCLDSLLPATLNQNVSVYILNVQGDATELAHHPINPVIIDERNNYGFTGGNNILIKKAMADGCNRLVLLNNDTEVANDFLEPLLESLEDKRVGMVCPKIYFYKGNEFHQKEYSADELGRVIWYAGGIIDWNHVAGSHWGVDEVDHGQFSTSSETMFATGCCVAIRSDVVKKVGLLDDRYFLYYEDADWSQRALCHGYKIMVEPKSVVWHKNAGSTAGPGSNIHRYYQTRNRFLFGMKYAPLRVKYHLFKQYIAYLLSSDKTMKKAAQDALSMKYGACTVKF